MVPTEDPVYPRCLGLEAIFLLRFGSGSLAPSRFGSGFLAKDLSDEIDRPGRCEHDRREFRMLEIDITRKLREVTFGSELHVSHRLWKGPNT